MTQADVINEPIVLSHDEISVRITGDIVWNLTEKSEGLDMNWSA
jgi:hypothetical protein